MAEMFAAAKVMMQPYDAEAGSMRISSIVDDGDGVTKVAWSDAYAMSPLSEGSVVTVPDGIIPSPGSAIVAEVQFNYQSPFGYVLKLERTVSDKFYLRPRRVSEISRTHKPDGDGTSFGPTS